MLSNYQNYIFEVGTRKYSELKEIDELFEKIKKADSRREKVKLAEDVEIKLKKIFKGKFYIHIEYGPDQAPPRVIPILSKDIDELLNKREVEFKDFHQIHIYFGDKFLRNFESTEITAVLLHELGHVKNFMSDKSEKLNNYLSKYERLLNLAEEVPVINTLLFPIILITSRTMSFTSHAGEYNADRFVASMGYGDEYIKSRSRLEKMAKRIRDKKSFNISETLERVIDLIKGTTHPTSKKRVENLAKQMIEEYSNRYNSKRIEKLLKNFYNIG